MVVRCFWRNCDFRGGKHGAQPIDAFWVEATDSEAESLVFPKLTATAVAASRDVAMKFRSLAEHLANPVRPFCFLVTRDLSAIDPMHVHYPFHQLWNGYSPFEQIGPKEITNLDALRSITLPDAPPEPPAKAQSELDEIDEDEL